MFPGDSSDLGQVTSLICAVPSNTIDKG